MRKHYRIYSSLTGQCVTARRSERAARRYCAGKFRIFWYRYEE